MSSSPEPSSVASPVNPIPNATAVATDTTTTTTITTTTTGTGASATATAPTEASNATVTTAKETDTHLHNGNATNTSHTKLKTPPPPVASAETNTTSPVTNGNGNDTKSNDDDTEEKKEDPNIRVASHRISQLGSNPFSKQYVIKRPLESKFEVPELIENRQLEVEEEEQEENPNIFMRHHGGITYIDDEGNLGNEVYLCGIIDILQKYNKRKKVENFFKGIKQDT
ncbi:hypothetical protein RFI_16434, partial [Reticulomyxa filosa]